MQYSLINGQKTEAQPNLVGTCINCGEPTYSACGKYNIWHWRHKSKKNCDNWWEPETPWHREWKANFPESWREVVHFDDNTNEKHIADIKTKQGVVLEFQNSPISEVELKSREEFYKKMIWIINGKSFKENFEFGYKLPAPSSDFPQKFKFMGYRHPLGYDITDPENQKSLDGLNLIQILNNIDGENINNLIEKHHTRHYTFNWKNQRKVWLKANMPIFIDFNDGIIWRIILSSRLHDSPICAHYSKKQFLQHYLK